MSMYSSLPQSGCYALSVGNVFYIGSSRSMKRRIQGHLTDLRGGRHSSGVLQAAWDLLPESHTFECLEECCEADLRDVEQRWIDRWKHRVGFANGSDSSRGPGELAYRKVRELWKDPLFRERMSKLSRSREFTMEHRGRMSAAKKGARNPRSRGVWVEMPDGSRHEFECVSDAARFLGVTQQAADLWLRGVTKMPGRGRHTRYPELQGMDMGGL